MSVGDPATAATGHALLEARGLRAVRAGDDGPVAVLDGVDFDARRGELVEISGPSGAGKTTLLLALARLLPGVEGELRLAGAPAQEIQPRRWRLRVALLPQRAVLVSGTVAENLALPWRLAARSELKEPPCESLRAALDSVGMFDVALERDAARLSVGQAARIALLRVLLTRPEVLLLDEPDASLDDDSASAVARLTASFVAEGGSVVRVSHVRADAAATRRLRLDSGGVTELSRA